MQNILKSVGTIVLLCLCGIVMISSVEKKKTSIASNININIQAFDNGQSLVSEQDIMQTLDRHFGQELGGIPFGQLDGTKVEGILDADPFIQKAEVFRDAKDVLHLDITQSYPILRLVDKASVNYYLTEQGSIMPISKHFTARVPVANGKIPLLKAGDDINTNTFINSIYDLVSLIREDHFLEPMIEQIHINRKGEFTLVPKIGDQIIVLGSTENLESKFERLKTFYDEVLPHEGWDKYSSFSLKYKDQIVCNKR